VAWSDTSVTVRLNRADMSGEAYAFVVDADGQVHELGAIGSW
jgi:hypothetical protein